jgi:hypothetical protein
MREEDPIHILPPDSDLGETLQSTSTRVEQEFLPSGFDQNARPESIHGRWGSACTQESDSDLLPIRGGWNKGHEK